jgi:hypothetical protein
VLLVPLALLDLRVPLVQLERRVFKVFRVKQDQLALLDRPVLLDLRVRRAYRVLLDLRVPQVLRLLLLDLRGRLDLLGLTRLLPARQDLLERLVRRAFRG